MHLADLFSTGEVLWILVGYKSTPIIPEVSTAAKFFAGFDI